MRLKRGNGASEAQSLIKEPHDIREDEITDIEFKNQCDDVSHSFRDV